MKKTIYWAVTAKCGHVGGLSKYIPITFYVLAASKKAASDYVIALPRVKHHNKGVILSIENISFDEYVDGIVKNNSDVYLKCSNIQEQKLYLADLSDRIIDEDDEWCLNRRDRVYKRTHCSENRRKNNIKQRKYNERMKQYCADYGLCAA